ncbi:MAG: glutaredoxin domain-containing protein [Gammaproteobacteria bacterium]
MAEIKIYSTATCPICDKTKALLQKWGLAYDEVRVDQDTAGLKEMLAVSNHARTVPQIVIQGKWIGGFSELTELHMDGALDELIAAAAD